MKAFIILMFFLGGTLQLAAQKEINYPAPPTLELQNYSISVQNVVAKRDYCKLRLSVTNTSEGLLECDFKKVAFVYKKLGTHYPEKGETKVILPGETVAATLLIEDKLNYVIEEFDLILEGLRFAPEVKATPFEVTKIEANKSIQVAGFHLENTKSLRKKDNFYFTYKTTFKGTEDELAIIDVKHASIASEAGRAIDAKIVPHKVRYLKNGQAINISGDFESRDAIFNITWGETFKLYTFSNQKVPAVWINKEGKTRAQPEPVVDNSDKNNHKSTNNTTKSTTTNTNEFSGSGGNEVANNDDAGGYRGKSNCSPENVTNGQFRDMKAQVKKETSTDAKYDRAKRLVKGRCMTAEQVAELCRLLSDDNRRLDLAKYSFEFTYDIDNYSAVVDSIESSSKKEALEKMMAR